LIEARDDLIFVAFDGSKKLARKRRPFTDCHFL
jgi:hypothetical protein